MLAALDELKGSDSLMQTAREQLVQSASAAAHQAAHGGHHLLGALLAL